MTLHNTYVSPLSSRSSLVEGNEGSYQPNNQTNLVIALHDTLSLLFCHFINTSAYHWAYTSLHLLLAVALPTFSISVYFSVKMNFSLSLSQSLLISLYPSSRKNSFTVPCDYFLVNVSIQILIF